MGGSSSTTILRKKIFPVKFSLHCTIYLIYRTHGWMLEANIYSLMYTVNINFIYYLCS